MKQSVSAVRALLAAGGSGAVAGLVVAGLVAALQIGLMLGNASTRAYPSSYLTNAMATAEVEGALRGLTAGFVMGLVAAFLGGLAAWMMGAIAGAIASLFAEAFLQMPFEPIGHSYLGYLSDPSAVYVALILSSPLVGWMMEHPEALRSWTSQFTGASSRRLIRSWPLSLRWVLAFNVPWSTFLLIIGVAMSPQFFGNWNYVKVYGAAATWNASYRQMMARRSYGCGPSCQGNLKQLGLAMKQYSQDYDDHLPLVAAGNPPQGWADAVMPYVRAHVIYNCPADYFEPHSDIPTQRGYCEYWYNLRLGGQRDRGIVSPAMTVQMGEGGDGFDLTDSRYSKASLSPRWATDPASPSWRHRGGANYGFADGHVKWLAPGAIGTGPTATGGYTFALK